MATTTDTPTVAYATVEIRDIEVMRLGIIPELLVRPIIDEDVEMLVETDETEWDAIEVRPWPDEWEKPAPHILYHVISGNHRTRAARKKGLATLKGKIVDAPDERSYTVAAVKSNTRHGKNFTKEQKLELARKLSEQGLSLAEIAKVFSCNKSTVHNWLSGRDSNVSKKRTEEEENTAVAYATLEHVSPDLVRNKLQGWLGIAPISIKAEDARHALHTLPEGMQVRAQQMRAWLIEVLREEEEEAGS